MSFVFLATRLESCYKLWVSNCFINYCSINELTANSSSYVLIDLIGFFFGHVIITSEKKHSLWSSVGKMMATDMFTCKSQRTNTYQHSWTQTEKFWHLQISLALCCFPVLYGVCKVCMVSWWNIRSPSFFSWVNAELGIWSASWSELGSWELHTANCVVSNLKRSLLQSRSPRIMDSNSFAIGIFIALSSSLTIVSSQRERCLGNYCSGSFGDIKAICKDRYCYCTGQDYDYNTCLRKFF